MASSERKTRGLAAVEDGVEMKQARFKRFMNRWILSSTPGWAIGRSNLVQRQDEAILLLILFSNSSFDWNWSAIHAVVFPLYLDYEYLALSISEYLMRNPRRSWMLMPWEDDPDEHEVGEELLAAIHQQGILFLNSLGTVARLAAHLPELRAERGRFEQMDLQALAGAAILLGDAGRATEYIRAHSELLRDEDRPPLIAERQEWERIGERLTSDEAGARAELRERIARNAVRFKAPAVNPVDEVGAR